MGWFKDKKADGTAMTPEEIQKEQDEFKNTLRATFDDAVKPIQASFEQRLRELEGKLPKPVERAIENVEMPSVLDNEDAAFTARVGPVALELAMLRAKVTESEVLSEVASKGWGEFIPEIRKTLDAAGAQIKAMPTYGQYVNNVVKMIVGAKAMEGGLKFSKDKQTFFIEDAGSGNGTPSATSKLRDEATDGRVDIIPDGSIENWARKMGIKDLDAFAKEPA